MRRLVDRDFCSRKHRRLGSRRSARALRDAGELFGDDELWGPVVPVIEPKQQKSGARYGAGAAVLICALIVAVLWLNPSGGGSGPSAGGGLFATTGLGNAIQRAVPAPKIPRIFDDFRADLGDWVGDRSGASDWSLRPGELRPGKLRLWKPSLNLVDYQLEFKGQIEKKAIGWAYRAVDLQNYYGGKIVVTRTGRQARAEIQRFVVLEGKSRDHVSTPLPGTYAAEMVYHVKLSAKGPVFQTIVNGRMVDSFRDARLAKGGIGFFADKDEASRIHWVTVTNHRKGFLGGLFALYLPYQALD